LLHTPHTTHQGIEKWFFTALYNPEAGKYDERGWTTWEKTVAGLLNESAKYVFETSSTDDLDLHVIAPS
jgi:hypothetical protein